MPDSIPRLADSDRQPAREANARIALALSILQHRHFCPCCRTHAEQARYALLGATVQELADGIAG